jgi:hypothetical protein
MEPERRPRSCRDHRVSEEDEEKEEKEEEEKDEEEEEEEEEKMMMMMMIMMKYRTEKHKNMHKRLRDSERLHIRENVFQI